jgi:hypothetical protein
MFIVPHELEVTHSLGVLYNRRLLCWPRCNPLRRVLEQEQKEINAMKIRRTTFSCSMLKKSSLDTTSRSIVPTKSGRG